MGDSGPIDSTYERFSQRPEVESRASKYTDLADHPRTWVTVIQYPDGEMEASGCHIGFPSRKPRPKATAEEKEKKAAARARRMVIRRCKFFALDKLWTATYRGAPRSHEVLYTHWCQFVAEVKKRYPNFSAVAVPELQTRKRGGTGANLGEYHIHFAVADFYEVNILRRAWWKVVGNRQGNRVNSRSFVSEAPSRW